MERERSRPPSAMLAATFRGFRMLIRFCAKLDTISRIVDVRLHFRVKTILQIVQRNPPFSARSQLHVLHYKRDKVNLVQTCEHKGALDQTETPGTNQ